MNKLRPFLIRLRFSMQMAWHGVMANPMRSFLTILGVTIGVAAVVSLMGIGEGARSAVMKQFESMGSNVIVIESKEASSNFNPDLAYRLVERVEPLSAMTPIATAKADMRWRRARAKVDILGTNSQFPIIRDNTMAEGKFFNELQVENYSKVCVLGANLASELAGSRSAVGQTLTLSGLEYRIIGVLAPKGKGQAENIDDKIVIPYTTAQKLTNTRVVSQLVGKSTSKEDSALAMVQLSRIFKNKMGNQDEAVGGVAADSKITITNMDDMVQQADKANRVMTMLLGGIAAVSLLVGGLGIMNIMLVAVSERTGEIGVRRALGARQSDLIIQFMLESLYLSFAGAIFGVVIGILSMNIFGKYGFETAISITAIQVAVSVALGCGVIFGVYPALNASSVPPVEALRRG